MEGEMPSNEKLTEQIKELDSEAITEGLNNKQLSALLLDLKTPKLADADADAQVKAVAEQVKAATPTKPPYIVELGKSVTSKKGIRDQGQEIKPEWLGGGNDALLALIESGYVVSNA
jgi:hypothetical protein